MWDDDVASLVRGRLRALSKAKASLLALTLVPGCWSRLTFRSGVCSISVEVRARLRSSVPSKRGTRWPLPKLRSDVASLG